jgi:hypothetical protein
LKKPFTKRGIAEWIKWKSTCLAGAGPEFKFTAVKKKKS